MSDTYDDDLPLERGPAKKTTTSEYVAKAKYDAEASANNLLEIELENRLIEIERLKAKNTKLEKVVEAARELSVHIGIQGQFILLTCYHDLRRALKELEGE